MNVSGVSDVAKNQAVGGKIGSQSTQGNNGNSSGWKYVTVKEGDITYTYIVIGKNMKVLIGTAKADEDQKDKDKDNKGAKAEKDQKVAAGNTEQVKALLQNAPPKKMPEQTDFIADFRMFGLTAFHQKKMRETIKKMEDNFVYGKIDQPSETTKNEDKSLA